MPRFHFYKTETENVLLLEILDEKTQLIWHLMVNRKKDELRKESVTFSQGYRDYVPALGVTTVECPKSAFMTALTKMQQQSAMYAHEMKKILQLAQKESEL